MCPRWTLSLYSNKIEGLLYLLSNINFWRLWIFLARSLCSARFLRQSTAPRPKNFPVLISCLMQTFRRRGQDCFMAPSPSTDNLNNYDKFPCNSCTIYSPRTSRLLAIQCHFYLPSINNLPESKSTHKNYTHKKEGCNKLSSAASLAWLGQCQAGAAVGTGLGRAGTRGHGPGMAASGAGGGACPQRARGRGLPGAGKAAAAPTASPRSPVPPRARTRSCPAPTPAGCAALASPTA